MPFYAPKDLVIRASTPGDQLVPAVREIIRSVDPLQPVSDVRRMVDIVDAETASRSVQVTVLAGFAAVAFLLAAIGIHGVSRSPCRSGPPKSECESRSVRSAATSCAWSCAADSRS